MDNSKFWHLLQLRFDYRPLDSNTHLAIAYFVE